MHLTFTLSIIAAYLLGSIPFGLIIARAHGIDLRSIGSGNIGATNVSRALGKRWAYFCFLLDMLKGFVPIFLASGFIFSQTQITGLVLSLSVGIAAILGHVFPIYLKFKGGKGVATSFGVAIGFWPYYTICAIVAAVVFVAVAITWRYISLASIIAAAIFPLTLLSAIAIIPAWHFSYLWPICLIATAIPLMVLLLHRENIKRIAAGTESKIFQNSDKKS